ncbi:MAG TPA: terminase large subunit [Thermoanaerobaculia bacterium]|nr:terminase large subunit [Thermoanaerobaculia bacterium]
MADKALEFFTLLRLEDGSSFALLLFQQFIVGSLFGWYRGANRRFRNAYLEMGKGNGKSPLAGGIGLYLLVVDDEPAPEVYCAAATRDQAAISFKDAKGMAEASEDLRELLEIKAHHLFMPENGGILRPVSSEGRGLDGKRVHGALIDEVHQHPTPIVCDKMRAGVKRRLNGLVVEITNSGFDRNSVCYAHHNYGIEILQGKQENDEWFVYICAMDEADVLDETGQFSLSKLAANPGCWVKTNPGLGPILPKSYLDERVREALGMPSRQSEVLRFNFCVWVGSEKVWIPDEIWMARKAEPERELLTELRSQPCYGGLDLARSRDLTCFALAFPPYGERTEWAYLEWYWIDEGTAQERAERDRAPYLQWLREDVLRRTSGNVTDFRFIKADILDIVQEYQVQAIAYDRTFASQLITELGEEGVQMVPWAQTPWNMEAAISEIERQAFGGLMVHGGHPITRWCMGNVVLRSDSNGNRAIDKQRARERVDGATAYVNAVGWGIRAEPDDAVSFYGGPERPDGLLVI